MKNLKLRNESFACVSLWCPKCSLMKRDIKDSKTKDSSTNDKSVSGYNIQSFSK
jgi:hypothetical protein